MASISGFIDRNHIRLLTSSSTGGNTRLLYRSHTSILEQKKKKKLSKRVYIYMYLYSLLAVPRANWPVKFRYSKRSFNPG